MSTEQPKSPSSGCPHCGCSCSGRPGIEKHYSLVKLGALLGFHRNTMGELLKEGAFPNAVQVGNKKLVPQSDVEAWLKKMRITQSKEVA